MPGGTPGPQGASGNSQSAKDGKTTALLATPPPSPVGVTYTGTDELSFEMQDAPYVCVPTRLHSISLAEMRVLAALRQHKTKIIEAEARFSVDRRAIAGAIAWEALHNNKLLTNWAHNYLGAGRAVGWGKDHTRLNLTFGGVEGTWSFQVEKRGLLKKQTLEDRKVLLANPDAAIDYVAAAMDLIAIIYEAAGSPGICKPEIRVNPVILANVYNGDTPEKWEEKVKAMTPKHVLSPGNKMAVWLMVTRNMDFIEDAVGSPPKELGEVCKIRDVSVEEGNRLLKAAKEYLDAPYSYGGGTKAGIDCSNLVYRAINDVFPSLGYKYAATDIIASSPQLRKLGTDEAKQAGDIILFAHHVGFYDPAPPTDKAGQTLLSARGDQNHPQPGVTWGKPEWFGAVTGVFRVIVPCE